MPDQHKTPLKVGQSGCNFHRKLSLYQRMILYRAGPLEGYFRNFNFSPLRQSPKTEKRHAGTKLLIYISLIIKYNTKY